MSGGRCGGELEHETAAALRAVADPDNWRGLNASQKADLQAEINRGLSREQRRTVAALLKKKGK